MRSIKKRFTVDIKGQVQLKGLPFEKGEKVEIFIVSETVKGDSLKAYKELARDTRKFPSNKKISDEDIEKEIAFFRTGK